MRSIFTFTITLLILTACSQTPTSVTRSATPLPSMTPTSISTVTPTFLPIITSTTPPIPDITSEQLADMTTEQKLAAAPDEKGFTKTISGVYVIYTDEAGLEKDTAYNLTTGEWERAPEISSAPPAEGWNTVIADGLALYPEGIAWVDVGGVQHFKFDQGDAATDEQKIAELKAFCPPNGCILGGKSLWMYGRYTGDMELTINKDGEMELMTSMDILNTLRDGELQTVRQRYLLPEWNEASQYYYKNLGLNSKSEFDMKTILKTFKEGRLSTYLFFMNPGAAELASLGWKTYLTNRISDTYLQQLRAWFADGLDPKDDMELIGF